MLGSARLFVARRIRCRGPVLAAAASQPRLSTAALCSVELTRRSACAFPATATTVTRNLSSSSSDNNSSGTTEDWSIPPSLQAKLDATQEAYEKREQEREQKRIDAAARALGLDADTIRAMEGEMETERSDVSATTASTSTIPVDHAEWVPPDRPLVGDRGRASQYEHVQDQIVSAELEKEMRELESWSPEAPSATKSDDNEETVDWLATRRAVRSSSPSTMARPHDGVAVRRAFTDDDIAVKHHVLLTVEEIIHIMGSMGGGDVKMVPNPGGRYGTMDGIILVTANNYSQMRLLAETLIRQLRRRKLQEVDVVAAQQGAEGNIKDKNETWLAVDCRNYVVHIQDAIARRSVNLEALWTGKDRLHTLNLNDEEAVDDYCLENPVPKDYHAGGGSPLGTAWDSTLKRLERDHFAEARRPVVPKRRTKKGTRR